MSGERVTKNSLQIRLAEGVIFLRGAGDGRSRNDSSPALLRGLLTFTVANPIRVSYIECEFVGTTRTDWPDGEFGTRRVDVTEESQVFKTSTVFFHAESSTRRSASVGPGIALDQYADGEESHSAEDIADRAEQTARTRSARSPLPRRISVDQPGLQSGSSTPFQAPVPPLSPYPEEPPPDFDDVVFSAPASPRTLPQDLSQNEDDRRSRSSLSYELSLESDETATIRQSIDHPSTGQASSQAIPIEPLRLVNTADAISDVGGTALSNRHSRSQSARPLSSQSSISSRSSGLLASPTVASIHPNDSQDKSRPRSRFRFSAVSSVLQEVKERVHDGRAGRAGSVDSRDDSSRVRGRKRDKSTFGRITEALGFEPNDAQVGDGWKQFGKGTYTYPISFAIPSSTPPSLECDYGSISYKLKASVHRPGTFASKLTAIRNVTLVACPGDDDTEEAQTIVVERQWDTQLRYLISLDGKSFPIGGSIPFSLTLMPLAKTKIHRISAAIEERVDYYGQYRRAVRHDAVRKFDLLSIKYEDKDAPPILPMFSDTRHTSAPSPFAEFFNLRDESGVAAQLYDPTGPWFMHFQLKLPTDCGRIHFSTRHVKSNIKVLHLFKMTLRVERGDDAGYDKTTGKKKLFDIVIQTPIHILSCHCNSQFTSLPTYRMFDDDSYPSNEPTFSCSHRQTTRAPRTIGEWYSSRAQPAPDTVPPFAASFINGAGPSITAPPGESGHNPTRGDVVEDPGSEAAEGVDAIEARRKRYARLVAGEVSETGDEPPSYEDSTQVAAESRRATSRTLLPL